jgi:hypothetical protein
MRLPAVRDCDPNPFLSTVPPTPLSLIQFLLGKKTRQVRKIIEIIVAH